MCNICPCLVVYVQAKTTAPSPTADLYDVPTLVRKASLCNVSLQILLHFH